MSDPDTDDTTVRKVKRKLLGGRTSSDTVPTAHWATLSLDNMRARIIPTVAIIRAGYMKAGWDVDDYFDSIALEVRGDPDKLALVEQCRKEAKAPGAKPPGYVAGRIDQKVKKALS